MFLPPNERERILSTHGGKEKDAADKTRDFELLSVSGVKIDCVLRNIVTKLFYGTK